MNTKRDIFFLFFLFHNARTELWSLNTVVSSFLHTQACPRAHTHLLTHTKNAHLAPSSFPHFPRNSDFSCSCLFSGGLTSDFLPDRHFLCWLLLFHSSVLSLFCLFEDASVSVGPWHRCRSSAKMTKPALSGRLLLGHFNFLVWGCSQLSQLYLNVVVKPRTRTLLGSLLAFTLPLWHIQYVLKGEDEVISRLVTFVRFRN